MKKALITGVTGFVGQWLSSYLTNNGYDVIGIDQAKNCPINYIGYSQINILDTERLTRLLKEEKPQSVYHLAAISFVPEADQTPLQSLNVNIMGTVSVLDAVKRSGENIRILQVGSSKEYDDTVSCESIEETLTPNPQNFYGISKYASEITGLQYVKQFGTDVRFVRSFNHTGPGQSQRFVCSEWAKKIAEISLGITSPEITVKNINPFIDFSDVRDVVKAYNFIMEKGSLGEIYNVCSGKGTQLKKILNYLIQKSDKPIKVVCSGNSNETKIITGNNTKLKAHTGWENSFTIEKTLDDLYDYWVKTIRNS